MWNKSLNLHFNLSTYEDQQKLEVILRIVNEGECGTGCRFHFYLKKDSYRIAAASRNDCDNFPRQLRFKPGSVTHVTFETSFSSWECIPSTHVLITSSATPFLSRELDSDWHPVRIISPLFVMVTSGKYLHA